jgi:hypothetical protein
LMCQFWKILQYIGVNAQDDALPPISFKQKGRPQGRPTFFAPDRSGSSHQISFG